MNEDLKEKSVTRSCAAVFDHSGQRILMVKHREGEREYWTLPGGGIEEGEDPASASERETLEETGVSVDVVEFLFDEEYIQAGRSSVSHCFLCRLDGDPEAHLGHDPEEVQLPPERRMLIAAAWRPLDEVRDDKQVSKVLELLAHKGRHRPAQSAPVCSE